MAGGGETGFLETAAVFLGAAVVAVPLFKRLQMGSVIGYLAAGAAIGPFGLKLVREVETVVGFAEFGVVLLLFVIGLELRPARLWRLRVEIFGLGAAQVGLTTVAIFVPLMLLGLGFAPALAIASALALSSTAFAVQLLRERGELTLPFGNRAFSILLFQDLAIVPLLALVAILAPGGEEGGMSGGMQFIVAVAAVGALILVARFGLQPLFVLVARSKADEVFTATALLVVIGSALLMHAVGLSMAMGAFIAGVLLAETEFRHQLEADIEPFRGLLLGLFFMSFGMTIDWSLVAANWATVLFGSIALFGIKGVILFGLSRWMGSPRSDALRIGATLGQGGEFAFVLFAAAALSGLLTGEVRSILSAIVTASMVLTPFAIRAVERLARDGDEDAAGDDMKDVSEAPKTSSILVAGFGRVGQVVARVMRLRGYAVTLIDNSPRRIRMAATFGNQVYYGDATRTDVLRTAGAETADIIFLCIDDRSGAREAVSRIRERFPNARIFVDTYDRFTEWELREAGAHEVVRETFESAVTLARKGLEALGDGDVADDLIEEFRKRDAEMARLQNQYGAKAGLEKLREKYSLDSPG